VSAAGDAAATGPERYPLLFSPLRIGTVTVRNRLMQTAHGKMFSASGMDTDRDRAYQVARARGGIGLIVTGSRPVHPTAYQARLSVAYDAAAIDSDRRTTAAVHEHGAVIFAQLAHFGANGTSETDSEYRVLWSSSAVPGPMYGETPKAMDHEDIAELVDWWARSAEIAREGGYDGVELHFAHSYLMHQFISPLHNHRTDEYGGSLENRLRLPRAVIGEVRRRIGRDFTLGVRLGMTDFTEGGLSLDGGVAVATALEADGLIDYVSASAAGLDKSWEIAPSDRPDGWLVELAATVKAALAGLPLFVVGGLKDPAHAEEILRSGGGDMVAMTRAQIADPQLATKAREGREQEIYHCIRGNQGCIARVYKSLPIACTVNPETGREGRFGSGALPRVATPRRWVVVGGGPAGLKAAETLGRRGHHVMLLEREQRLGGQVNLILATPGRERFHWIVTDLRHQLETLDVDVRLGVEATVEVVAGLRPDGVVVATGAVPARTGFTSVLPLVERVKGIEQPHVLDGWDVLAGDGPSAGRVLVLDDSGGRYAAGVAEVLLDRGCAVELVSRFSALFPRLQETLESGLVCSRLLGKGLSYRLHRWARRIGRAEVEVVELHTGGHETLQPVDAVVLATPPRADDALFAALRGAGPPVHRIGDCVAPRRLDHAIYEGYLAGRELWSTEDRYRVEGSLERAEGPLPG
jgi:mycofactocin system FadH/OYE family oxidoreductase 2